MPTTAYSIELKPNPFDQYCISAGFKVGDLIFLSGHVAIDEAGIPIKGGFDVQANVTFENLERSLQNAGSSLDKIIKVTIYLTNMKQHRPKIIELRKKWFNPPYPADTLVEVSALGDPSRLIEIEAIALSDGRVARQA
ncbi:MAG: RidA family protein [Pseudomonadota bacterium]|nr:RidA family protein [Pseudomonadota bacterium]